MCAWRRRMERRTDDRTRARRMKEPYMFFK
jgi:hypothetical protein